MFFHTRAGASPPVFTSRRGFTNSSTPVAAKTRENTAAQLTLLEELKAAAQKLGIQVREERLLREVGYRVRSGSCRVRESDIIFLERGLPPSAQIDVLVDELSGRPMDEIYLSPAARALVERAAAKGVRRDGGSEALCG